MSTEPQQTAALFRSQQSAIMAAWSAMNPSKSLEGFVVCKDGAIVIHFSEAEIVNYVVIPSAEVFQDLLPS